MRGPLDFLDKKAAQVFHFFGGCIKGFYRTTYFNHDKMAKPNSEGLGVCSCPQSISTEDGKNSYRPSETSIYLMYFLNILKNEKKAIDIFYHKIPKAKHVFFFSLPPKGGHELRDGGMDCCVFGEPCGAVL